jgi:hypothetical protein
MARYLHSLMTVVIVLASIVIQPPQPAAAVDSLASYNNGTFTRPDGQPIMTLQETCVYCVASATQAWIDYTRLVNGQDTRPSQDYMNHPSVSLWPTGLLISAQPGSLTTTAPPSRVRA